VLFFVNQDPGKSVSLFMAGIFASLGRKEVFRGRIELKRDREARELINGRLGYSTREGGILVTISKNGLKVLGVNGITGWNYDNV